MNEQIAKVAEIREAIERYATMLRDCDEEGDYVSLSDIARDLDKFVTKLNALHIRLVEDYDAINEDMQREMLEEWAPKGSDFL